MNLLERSTAKIRMITIDPEAKGRELFDLWTLQYELEYKYARLKNSQFKGLPERKRNIIRLIEQKANALNQVLANTFQVVFSDWLSQHQVYDIEAWINRRMSIDGGVYYYEAEGIESAIEVFAKDMGNFNNNFPDVYDTVEWMLENHEDKCSFITNGWIEDITQSIGNAWVEVDQDDEDELDSFLEDNQVYLRDFKNHDDLIQYMKDDFCETDVEDIVDLLELFDQYGVPSDFYASDSEAYDFMYTLYEESFDSYINHFNGLEATVDKVQKAYDYIKDIDTMSIEKQFMHLNIAKNLSHHTGDFMEYYSENYQVTRLDFDLLSDLDVAKWDTELTDIGVIL